MPKKPPEETLKTPSSMKSSASSNQESLVSLNISEKESPIGKVEKASRRPPLLGEEEESIDKSLTIPTNSLVTSLMNQTGKEPQPQEQKEPLLKKPQPKKPELPELPIELKDLLPEKIEELEKDTKLDLSLFEKSPEHLAWLKNKKYTLLHSFIKNS